MKQLNHEAYSIAFNVKLLGLYLKTPVYIRQRRASVLLEARVGVNAPSIREYIPQGYSNPFDNEFEEQYCSGIGRTEEEACEKLKVALMRYSYNV